MVGMACLGLVPAGLLAGTESDQELMEENQIRMVTWADYQGFETMRSALSEIFENLGDKYRVNLHEL
jgi:hypothetical protein